MRRKKYKCCKHQLHKLSLASRFSVYNCAILWSFFSLLSLLFSIIIIFANIVIIIFIISVIIITVLSQRSVEFYNIINKYASINMNSGKLKFLILKGEES